MANEAFLIAGIRTPIGAMNGVLAGVPATELGAICIKQVLKNAGVAPDQVDEVIMGNVVSAGIGQNPARQATIKAGLVTPVTISYQGQVISPAGSVSALKLTAGSDGQGA